MKILMQLAIRNLIRNARRSLLTAGMVTSGAALLTLTMAWVNGIFGTMLDDATASAGHVRVVQPEYARLEQLMPLYENMEDTAPIVEEIGALPSVVSVYPRILTGAMVTVGDEIGDVLTLVQGAPLALYEKEMNLKNTLTPDSRWFEGEGDVLVGSKIAERLGAKVGDEIRLIGSNQDGGMAGSRGTIAGIVSADNPALNSQVFLPLEEVQYMTDIMDGATEVLVFGATRDHDLQIATALRSLPGASDLKVEPWSQRDPWSGLVLISNVIWLLLTVVIVFITALGVWNTMTMSVMERTGEIGVMRAMGMRWMSAVGLFVIEALCIALVGGLVGIALGGLGGMYLEVYGVDLGAGVVENMGSDIALSSTLYADVNLQVLGYGLLMSGLMALIGSALPATRAALIQPVEAMRARR